jgi:carbonic anhydrase/acetyltransferase-like protein (isoleucine patch superfamily)
MSVILPYNGKYPKIDPSAFIAPNATVVGDVTIGAGSSIWYGTVLRGDFQPIVIGKYVNVQDNCTVHVMGKEPTIIGDNVIIGHNAIIHCGHVGNNVLIGMGSILLGYTEIGSNCVIGAGTLLTQHKKIPSNSLVYGDPARIIRALRDDESEALTESAKHYYDIAMAHMESIKEAEKGN